MSGAAYVDKMSLERLFLSSAISGIRIRHMEGVSAVFDGGLFYEYLPDSSSLTGDIDLKKAKYAKKIEFSSYILGLREIRESPDKYPEFLEKTEINIHVAGSDNIIIDNNIARTPVRMDLNVMGTIAKYGLIGRIETDEGNIYFRGNEFEVLKGSSVEFIETNRISPVFHLMAETYISSYYIKLLLDGTMDRFDLSLFSDPPLSEVDILSLLTLGQVKGGEQGFSSGLAASEAASLLTGNIQGEVQEEFRNITGFERFEIEPHTTRTGSFSPKVTVGKRLLEDKLFVIYSTSIGTTEEHVIKLKYNLNKNISVEGSRNEIGSAGGDLKYRFEFK
jgi:translocation and assembly module TamB